MASDSRRPKHYSRSIFLRHLQSTHASRAGLYPNDFILLTLRQAER